MAQYRYIDGILHVQEADMERAYSRPCDWAADCGPVVFLGGARSWTHAALQALDIAAAHTIRPIRGMPEDFLVFFSCLGDEIAVCGVACSATTLTVRFEDVWLALQPDRRAFAYDCAVTRDPNAKDAPESRSAGVIREALSALAPDVRICIDISDNGGFVLSFRPRP